MLTLLRLPSGNMQQELLPLITQKHTPSKENQRKGKPSKKDNNSRYM